MKEKILTQTLERFMDGETTLDEEAFLADFFRNATDNDKPADIAAEDWQAYREMFRQFEEGFESPAPQKAKHKSLWTALSAAAAVILLVVCLATLSLNKGNNEMPLTAEMQEIADTTTADTVRVLNVESIPQKQEKPHRQRRLPYSPPVPRNLIAANAQQTMTREDSLNEAMREVEAVVAAMTVYQELKISEICNVEYQEEEIY